LSISVDDRKSLSATAREREIKERIRLTFETFTEFSDSLIKLLQLPLSLIKIFSRFTIILLSNTSSGSFSLFNLGS